MTLPGPLTTRATSGRQIQLRSTTGNEVFTASATGICDRYYIWLDNIGSGDLQLRVADGGNNWLAGSDGLIANGDMVVGWNAVDCAGFQVNSGSSYRPAWMPGVRVLQPFVGTTGSAITQGCYFRVVTYPTWAAAGGSTVNMALPSFYGVVKDGGGPVPPSFTGNIANQVDAEDSPITPLDTAGQFSAGSGSGAVYSSTVLPLGLSLDTATGVISGTPTQPGTVSGIVVTLTTSEGSANSNAFDWEITDATSPSLSAPLAGSITSDGVTPIVSTNDTANGSMWALVELGANPDPDAATIKANGEQLDAPFSAPVIFTPVTGLIPGNDYQISYYQEDQAGNPSNIARVTFQTLALPGETVYTVEALPPPGSYSVLDGSGCGIGNQVEVPGLLPKVRLSRGTCPLTGRLSFRVSHPLGMCFRPAAGLITPARGRLLRCFR